MPIASIDLGTNTALLLIADWDGEKLTPLHDEARITRLGQNLGQTKSFHPEAIERLLKVLHDYQKICADFKVTQITAVGTAGFRKAQNASEVIQRIKKETGFEIKVISGDEEAHASYLSAFHDFGHLSPNLYALDIGGGSTEIISKEGGTSFDVGAVILTESIVKHDPVTEEEFQAMKLKINEIVGAGSPRPDSSVTRDDKQIRQDQGRGNPAPTLIGLAGSVTTLSAIKQKLSHWDGLKVQGSILTLDDIKEMITLFRKSTIAEKKKIPGMVAGREDTILAGTMILQKAMEKIGVEEVVVSDRGLRYGIIHTSKKDL